MTNISSPPHEALSLADAAAPAPAVPRAGPRGIALRPLLGLALPLGCALAWEAAVRSGLAQGRLMPPPSRIIVAEPRRDLVARTIPEAALVTHALAPLAIALIGAIVTAGVVIAAELALRASSAKIPS